MKKSTGSAEGGVMLVKGLFDSHCHLPIDGDLKDVRSHRQLICGIHEENWTAMQNLEKKSIPGVMVGYGLHPWWAQDRSTNWDETLTKLITNSPNAIVGEIGLDKIKGPPMEEQVSIFKYQLALAAAHNRPVSVHCVRAYGAMEAVICSKKDSLPKVIILHSWNGSPDTTKMLLKRSKSTLYFGISPMIVKGVKFPALLEMIPRDRMLVESDSHCPKTSVDDVNHVIEILSQLLSLPAESITELTAANAEGIGEFTSNMTIKLEEAARECISHAESSVTYSIGELRNAYVRSCQRVKEGLDALTCVEEATAIEVEEVDHEKLVEMWELTHPVNELYHPNSSADLTSIHVVEGKLLDLKSTTNDDRLRIFRTFIETLRSKTSDLIKTVSDSHLDTGPLMIPALPSIDMLKDFMNEKRPNQSTTQIDKDITNLTKRVQDLCSKTDSHEAKWKSGEEFLKSKKPTSFRQKQPPTQLEKHRWLSDQYEDIFDYQTKALKLLRNKGKLLQVMCNANSRYKERANTVKQEATVQIDELHKKITSVIQKSHTDMLIISNKTKECTETNTAMEKEFSEWRTSSDNRLSQNELRQEACWKQLFTVEEELKRLGIERRTEVEFRVKRVVEERQRKSSIQHLIAKGTVHSNLLENQVRNSEIAISILDFTKQSIVIGADKGITAQRKSSKHQLNEFKLEVQRKELELYRQQHHKAGDLIQKTDLYCDRLQRGMTDSWQLEILYREPYKRLLAEVESLKDFQRRSAAAFQPTETSLRNAGVMFIHPLAEEETDELKEMRAAYAKSEVLALEEIEKTRLDMSLKSSTIEYPAFTPTTTAAEIAPNELLLEKTTTSPRPFRPILSENLEESIHTMIINAPVSSVAAATARSRYKTKTKQPIPPAFPPPFERRTKIRS